VGKLLIPFFSLLLSLLPLDCGATTKSFENLKLEELWSIGLDGPATDLSYSVESNRIAFSVQKSMRMAELWEASPANGSSSKLIALKRGQSRGLSVIEGHWLWLVGGGWKIPFGGGAPLEVKESLPPGQLPFALGPEGKIYWGHPGEATVYFYTNEIYSVGAGGVFLRGPNKGKRANDCADRCRLLLRDSLGKWILFSEKDLFWGKKWPLPSRPAGAVVIFGRESGAEKLVVSFPGEKRIRAYRLRAL
jgi:hypothetical protein